MDYSNCDDKNVSGLINNALLISVFCCIIPFVFMGTFIWMPESPVYLLSINKREKAKKSLQWFRGENYQVEVSTGIICL